MSTKKDAKTNKQKTVLAEAGEEEIRSWVCRGGRQPGLAGLNEEFGLCSKFEESHQILGDVQGPICVVRVSLAPGSRMRYEELG